MRRLQASFETGPRSMRWCGSIPIGEPEGIYLASRFSVDSSFAHEDLSHSLPRLGQPTPPESAFLAIKAWRRPVYSAPIVDEQGNASLQVHIPLLDRNVFPGDLIAEYSIENLLRFHVPAEVAKRHTVRLVDAQDRCARRAP